MRDIIFRGKNMLGGGWVEGHYWKSINGRMEGYIMTPENYPTGHEIDPDTLGQHTGLVDKNGKKVFEGDIVRCSQGCPHEVVWKKEHGGKYIGGMPAFYLSGLTDGYAWTEKEEVIGNRWDSPELLGSEDNTP